MNSDDKTHFGFWVYLMTDLVLFGTLFATFAVLRHNTAGGPTLASLFSLPAVLAETLCLLASSFSCGLSVFAAQAGKKQWAIAGLAATALLGAAFLGLELSEFHNLAREGHSWRTSGALSAFFTLVGTHGAHIFAGLIWLFAVAGYTLRRGLSRHAVRRLALFSLFWHFLDIVWIFIFTFVYLIGAAA